MNIAAPSAPSHIQASIAAGKPLAAIVPLCASRLEAFCQYAEWMKDRYNRAPSSDCAACGRALAVHQDTYLWEAVVNTRRTVLWSFLVSAFTLAVGLIFTRVHRVRFATRHGFCDACAGSARRQRWLSKGMHHLLFAGLIVSLFALIPMTIFALAMLFAAPDLVPKICLFLLAALVPFALCVTGFEWNRRLAIPAALRHIGRFPFVLRGVEREAATPDRAVPAPRPSPVR